MGGVPDPCSPHDRLLMIVSRYSPPCTTCSVRTFLWSIYFGSHHPTLHFLISICSGPPTNVFTFFRQTPLIRLLLATPTSLHARSTLVS